MANTTKKIVSIVLVFTATLLLGYFGLKSTTEKRMVSPSVGINSTMPLLNQWRSSTTPTIIIPNSSTAYVGLNQIASTTPTGNLQNGISFYDTITDKFRCYENGSWKDCDTTGGGGGSATTTINGFEGPDFTFATSTPTGLDFYITGSGSTITFTPQYASGYSIPLTASTTEGSTAFTWGNHASAGYISSVVWGDITGTLSNQTDLQLELDAKLSTTSAASTYQPIGSYLTTPVWTLGNGLIYNATSTDFVGIGTITPTTTLFVQGKGGTNPFNISSSTGTSLVMVDQAGNVGIGTTSPAHALTISSSAEEILHLNNPTSSFGGDWFATIGNGTQFAQGYFVISQDSTPTASNYEIQLHGDGGLTANSYLSAPVFNSFITGRGDSSIMKWTNTGGNFNGTLAVGQDYPNGVSNVELIVGEAAGSYIRVRDNANNEFLRVTDTGNVGIGTTSPAQLLSVAGNMRLTGALFDSSNASGTSGLILSSTGTGTSWISTSTLVGGNALTSLNGLTVSTQTFATGTATGIGLNITSSGSVHTFTPTVSSGYSIPLSASTTEWSGFYNTPSTRITDGTGLTWSGNTLNRDTISLTADVSGLLPIANGGTASSTLGTTLVGHVINGTNVTGSIANNTLTLGWTGDLAVSDGGTGAGTFTDHGVLVGSGTGALTALGVATDGQLIIGSTGADPVPATLNCDSNLTCTTGAGTLEIDVSLTPTFTTVNTGQGANELYAMDQDVEQADAVTFATSSLTALIMSGDTILDFAGDNLSVTNGVLNAASGGSSAWSLGSGVIYNATSTDNVGIGTSTPTALLSLPVGTTPASGISFGGDTNLYRGVADTLFTDDNFTTVGGDITMAKFSGQGYIYAFDTSLSKYISMFHDGTNAYLSSSAGDLILTPATNNVGIGTSTPTSTFHLQGTGSTNPFEISSSTSTSLLTMLPSGNTTFTGTLTASNLSGTNTGDVTLAGEDYLTLSTQQITAVAINPDNLAAVDFGAFTCNGTTCTLDTSYQPLDTGLTDIAGLATTTGNLILGNGTTWAVLGVGANDTVLTASSTAANGVIWKAIAGGGTVTSVGQTVPTGLTISGSPITGSGTLAIALDTGYVIPLQTTLDTFSTYTYGTSTYPILVGDNTLTGTNIFTGSIEIPNAASPTIDAAGETGLDTTDNQLVIADSGNTARVFGYAEQRLFSVTIASTSPFFSTVDLPIAKNLKDGRDITQYRCYVVDGTSFVVNVSDGTNDTETITCATTLTSDTDVATNSTFTAGELWEMQPGTITGTPNFLIFEAYGYITRE